MGSPASASSRAIARDRVEVLFREAEEAALEGEVERANRYVELARRVAMRAQYALPSRYRRRVCEGCYAYLLPGETARVRLRGGTVSATCEACGTVNRYPIDDR
jgi:ribonuclease P protein subunit RPR2